MGPLGASYLSEVLISVQCQIRLYCITETAWVQLKDRRSRIGLDSQPRSGTVQDHPSRLNNSVRHNP
jgi:hypothetical protein